MIKYRKEILFATFFVFFTVFCDTYAEGLHGNVRFRKFHYLFIFGGILGVGYILNVKRKLRLPIKMKVPKFIPIVSILLILLTLASSMIGAEGSIYSGFHLVIWHLMVIFFWYLIHSYTYTRTQNLIYSMQVTWKAVAYTSLVACTIGYFIFFISGFSIAGLTFSNTYSDGTDYSRMLSWFRSPNDACGLLFSGSYAFTVLLLFSKTRKDKFKNLLGLVYNLFALLLGGSRTYFLILVLLVVVLILSYVYFSGKNIMKKIVPILFFGIIGIGVFFLVAQGSIKKSLNDALRLDKEIISESDGEISFGNRTEVWKENLETVDYSSVQFYLIGGGLGSALEETEVSTHSGWLTLFINYGLLTTSLVLLTILVIMGTLFLMIFKLKLKFTYRMFLVLNFGFWIAVLAQNISTSIITIPKTENFIMLLVFTQFGLLYANKKKLNKSSGE